MNQASFHHVLYLFIGLVVGEIIKKLAEHVEKHGQHVDGYFSTKVSHRFIVAGMTTERDKRCYGHVEHR